MGAAFPFGKVSSRGCMMRFEGFLTAYLVDIVFLELSRPEKHGPSQSCFE